LIRVFPRRTKWTPTDNLAFVGYPPIFLPTEQPVKVSVTFTWDKQEGENLYKAWSNYYSDVELGGPAFDDVGNDFIPNMFIKEGVTITSRGCIRNCDFCLVAKREGKLRELNIKPGWIIQDNNLLACSRNHIEKVFEMLRQQNKPAIFSGGLDSRLLKKWHRELFDSIKVKELWFACDNYNMLPYLEKTAEILEGISKNKKRCYVMVGFKNESIEEAEKRLEKVYSLGFDPFCQLYQDLNKKEYTKDWKNLSRKWSRPAAYHSKYKEKTEILNLFKIGELI
jgi:hypothetical protein